MINEDFDKWPLHDASLCKIIVDWEHKTCQMDLNLFLKIGSSVDAVPYKIIWIGLLNVNIPFKYPWGKSVFINSQRKEGENKYIIEMQSGDEIKIESEKIDLIEVK